ncbi:MAG: hypothetical protein QG604_110 [Candidatus Dependentiae bacterium]|nr:hypothetical protein [Candidatus Dependentiae bacterium]
MQKYQYHALFIALLSIASPAYANVRTIAPVAAGGALSVGFFLISKKADAEAEIIKKSAQSQGLDYTKMPLYTFARRRSILLKVLAAASLAGGLGIAYHANKPAPAPHPSLAISYAIEAHDTDRAIALIKAEDPELLSFDIRTHAGGALAAAIREQNIAITKEIIDRIEADVLASVHDSAQTSMLGLAIKNESDEIAELIIHTIANCDARHFNKRDNANQTALMLAVQKEDGNRVARALIQAIRPEDLWLQGGRGGQWTALKLAAYYGKKETVKLLLSKVSSEPSPATQKALNDALESARQNGHTEIANLIADALERITTESLLRMDDSARISALTKAIEEENNSYALLLIKEMDPQLFIQKIESRRPPSILRSAQFSYPILQALVNRLKSRKDVLIDDQEVRLALASNFFNDDAAYVTKLAELLLPIMTDEGINRKVHGFSLIEMAAATRNQAAVEAVIPRTTNENLAATLAKDLEPNIRTIITDALRARAE